MKLKTKLLITVGSTLVLIGSYQLGHLIGKNEKILKYETKLTEQKAIVQYSIDKNEKLIEEHQNKETKLLEELKETTKKYEKIITDINSDYSNRLRQSEERSIVYRQQANSSVEERERLAIHAARLDRSLEEGRSLVRQLTETLRLRESELNKMGSIIKNDRDLLKE